MAGTTPRFGFNFFGAGTPGTISDNGQKYTSLDRLLLDRLLASVETHHHRYVPPTSGLGSAPTTTLLITGGQLSAGYTYYYKVAVIDLEGNESIASPEAAQGTPTPLQPPAMPGLSSDATAGTLVPGYYYYALTGLRGTEESTIGPAAMVNLVVGETSVLLDLPSFGSADSLRVWRMGSSDAGFTRIGIVNSPDDTFVDDGSTPADPCACDPGVAPPPFNTGISNYAIDVELPGTVDVTKIQSWKVYRSNYAGIYGAATLVHEVVERTDEWDITSPLVTVWTDTGLALQVGQPLSTDKNMRFQPFVFDHVSEDGDPMPDPAAYPEFYPFVFEGKLYAKIDDDWTLVGGGGDDSGGGGGMSSILTDSAGGRWVLGVDTTGALTTTSTIIPGPPSAPIDFEEIYVAIFDDAIFNVQAGTLIIDPSTKTTTMDTPGVTFDEAPYFDFSPYYTGAGLWTVTPHGDPLITGERQTVNIADWDVYPEQYGTFLGDSGTMDMYIVTLGSSVPAMGPTEPPDADLRLGTVPIDDIYVDAGKHYWMEVLFHFPVSASYDNKPEGYWHMYSWLDSSDAVIGSAIRSDSTLSYQPDNTNAQMYDLGDAPTGAVKLRVELGVWPHYYYALSPGAQIGFGRVVVFDDSPTGYYDSLLAQGWQGTFVPMTSGRHYRSTVGRGTIAGMDGTAPSSIGVIDTPPTRTQQTVVLAVSDNLETPVGWGAMFDIYAGFDGSAGLLYNTDISDMVPVATMGEGECIIGVALTVDASGASAVVNYYDLLHADAPLFTNHLDTTTTFRDGTVYLRSPNGLIRMGVWDRILTSEELIEALQAATGLHPHNMQWAAPAHNGGLPVTGYVISSYDGSKVTETKVGPEVTTLTLPLTASTAWIQAVNKSGRSTPSAVAFS